MSDLIIKISAESKEFSDAVKDIKKETADLESQLSSVAKISGVVFAGLIASAGVALKAFAESEKASKELENALKNQGIATNELVDTYKQLAAEVQAKTGIDDDAIVKGEAILQNFLGQTEVSKELVFALADLSEKTGSVESAAEILGRGIAGNTRGLKQFGIVIDENLDKNERLAKITEQVSQKFSGLAESGNQGLGSFRGLKAASSDFLENVGERLAPAVTEVVVSLTNFFNRLNENKPLLDFIVETGKIVGIIAGVVAGVASTAITLIKLQQAFAVAQAAVTAFGFAAKLAVGATGVGLLLVVAAEIYLNWNKIFPALQAIFTTFSNNITKIGDGLGEFLGGVFTFDLAKIKSGITKLKSVAVEGFENIKKAVPEEGELSLAKAVTSTPAQIAAAKKASDQVIQAEQDKRDTVIAQNELIALTLNNASAATIELKKKEIEILKQFEDEKYASQREALIIQLEETQAILDEQIASDLERQRLLNESKIIQETDYQNKTSAQKALFIQKNQQKLLEQVKTEQEIRDKAISDDQTARINANNKRLEDQIRYGAAYASINNVLNSQAVSEAQKTGNQLVQLQNSKNAELKAIGKAAAITQIGIDTAKGAMAAYASLATIPVVGPVLGIAAAGAVLAYGAERTANVVSAEDGGLIPGFNRGGDSVSSFLQPGELVVPRANFDEVVSAVADQRSALSTQSTSGVGGGGGGAGVMVDLRFSGDNAEKFLTARQVEARSLGTLAEATA